MAFETRPCLRLLIRMDVRIDERRKGKGAHMGDGGMAEAGGSNFPTALTADDYQETNTMAAWLGPELRWRGEIWICHPPHLLHHMVTRLECDNVSHLLHKISVSMQSHQASAPTSPESGRAY